MHQKAVARKHQRSLLPLPRSVLNSSLRLGAPLDKLGGGGAVFSDDVRRLPARHVLDRHARALEDSLVDFVMHLKHRDTA